MNDILFEKIKFKHPPAAFWTPYTIFDLWQFIFRREASVAFLEWQLSAALHLASRVWKPCVNLRLGATWAYSLLKLNCYNTHLQNFGHYINIFKIFLKFILFLMLYLCFEFPKVFTHASPLLRGVEVLNSVNFIYRGMDGSIHLIFPSLCSILAPRFIKMSCI